MTNSPPTPSLATGPNWMDRGVAMISLITILLALLATMLHDWLMESDRFTLSTD